MTTTLDSREHVVDILNSCQRAAGNVEYVLQSYMRALEFLLHSPTGKAHIEEFLDSFLITHMDRKTPLRRFAAYFVGSLVFECPQYALRILDVLGVLLSDHDPQVVLFALHSAAIVYRRALHQICSGASDLDLGESASLKLREQASTLETVILTRIVDVIATKSGLLFTAGVNVGAGIILCQSDASSYATGDSSSSVSAQVLDRIGTRSLGDIPSNSAFTDGHLRAIGMQLYGAFRHLLAERVNVLVQGTGDCDVGGIKALVKALCGVATRRPGFLQACLDSMESTIHEIELSKKLSNPAISKVVSSVSLELRRLVALCKLPEFERFRSAFKRLLSGTIERTCTTRETDHKSSDHHMGSDHQMSPDHHTSSDHQMSDESFGKGRKRVRRERSGSTLESTDALSSSQLLKETAYSNFKRMLSLAGSSAKKVKFTDLESLEAVDALAARMPDECNAIALGLLRCTNPGQLCRLTLAALASATGEKSGSKSSKSAREKVLGSRKLVSSSSALFLPQSSLTSSDTTISVSLNELLNGLTLEGEGGPSQEGTSSNLDLSVSTDVSMEGPGILEKGKGVDRRYSEHMVVPVVRPTVADCELTMKQIAGSDLQTGMECLGSAFKVFHTRTVRRLIEHSRCRSHLVSAILKQSKDSASEGQLHGVGYLVEEVFSIAPSEAETELLRLVSLGSISLHDLRASLVKVSPFPEGPFAVLATGCRNPDDQNNRRACLTFLASLISGQPAGAAVVERAKEVILACSADSAAHEVREDAIRLICAKLGGLVQAADLDLGTHKTLSGEMLACGRYEMLEKLVQTLLVPSQPLSTSASASASDSDSASDFDSKGQEFSAEEFSRFMQTAVQLTTADSSIGAKLADSFLETVARHVAAEATKSGLDVAQVSDPASLHANGLKFLVESPGYVSRHVELGKLVAASGCRSAPLSSLYLEEFSITGNPFLLPVAWSLAPPLQTMTQTRAGGQPIAGLAGSRPAMQVDSSSESYIKVQIVSGLLSRVPDAQIANELASEMLSTSAAQGSAPEMAVAVILASRGSIDINVCMNLLNYVVASPAMREPSVLARTMALLADADPMPVLFLRFILQTLKSSPSLTTFVAVEILPRLTREPVCADPLCFRGLCSVIALMLLSKDRRAIEAGCAVACSLTPERRSELLDRRADIRNLVFDYAKRMGIPL